MARSPLESTALAEIVQHDFRAAAILDGYHLDFCCGGALSLADACRQRGVDVQRVVAEIAALGPASPEAVDDDPVALIKHIVERHHSYVRQELPNIQRHLAKVVAGHGPRHPELAEIERHFSIMAAALTQHLLKEEGVLFPYITTLAEMVATGGPHPPDLFGTVQNPIRMMEIEHQEAGENLASIRQLSHDYTAPSDACNTYRLVLEELEAFEQDLHRHVHLENNVLFPRAVELETRADLLSRDLKSRQWEKQASDR